MVLPSKQDSRLAANPAIDDKSDASSHRFAEGTVREVHIEIACAVRGVVTSSERDEQLRPF
jgi:hypothetical protein